MIVDGVQLTHSGIIGFEYKPFYWLRLNVFGLNRFLYISKKEDITRFLGWYFNESQSSAVA